jgi:hypothetical protein
MRKFSILPDDRGSLDLSSAGAEEDFLPGVVQKPSEGLKYKRRIRAFKKEDLLILILVFLSAAMAAFFVLT